MKLLFVLESFEMGGVERVTLQLLRALSKNTSISLYVLCENPVGEFADSFDSEFKCFHLKGMHYFSKAKAFSGLVNEIQPDHVIFTKGGLSKYRFRFSNPKKIKYTAVQHVPIKLPETSVIKNIVRRLAAVIFYHSIDKVVSVSEGIREGLIKSLFLSTEKVITVYNPVLDSNITILANEDVEYNDFYVCVGRLHFQKGYDLLIRIVSKLKITRPSIKVIVLGDGPERNYLKAKILSEGLQDNIILHGSTDNPFKYIKASKGILLPSRWEGLPTVLVEAAYLGKQMVAFDCKHGPKELTNNGKAGYLISQGDVDGFVNAVLKIENNEFLPSPNTQDFMLAKAASNYIKVFEKIK
ncbi:hypothetical protein C1E24_19720 [Pseudoalteromonas phenolica]|uniref:Glycosyltransferase n=1 Tax=Pseudoalteromonas phenolica TaxID=161398 RepID=A0A5R9PWM9_9GAMM|nr:glycosyltransferase [Pseudoalteromonas phenolica]TLX45310.1 hypothetical protein C1E24_19720 [Pseudoalteromonas phenolica]